MEKALLNLKPNLVNALIPVVLRNLLWALVVSFVLFIFLSLKIVIIVLFVIFLVPLAIQIILLSSTTYHFFKTRVVSEFKFVMIKRTSVHYNNIVRIATNISIWDRMCKAGDITLHTAEDRTPDLVLKFIDKPRKVENIINGLIRKYKKA